MASVQLVQPTALMPQAASGTLPPLPVHRFTVDEYHEMLQHGVLTEDDCVELLDGWIVPKVPHNPPHDSTIQVIEDTLRKHLPVGWRLRVQMAITTDDSEPEPDVAIVRGHVRSYAHQHPRPADIGTLVEVAESSLLQDRSVKGPLYARARITCYWIVNLIDESVEVYSDPTGPTSAPYFRRQQTYQRGELVPLELDGTQVASIRVDDLLP
jgi:Uma2 family endonuclease